MMICYCLIQEGKFSPEEMRSLERGIEDIVEKHLASGVDLSWVTIAEGNHWLGGEPSDCSLVQLTTPDIEQSARVHLLAAIRDLWVQTTGCTAHDIMINAPPLSALAT